MKIITLVAVILAAGPGQPLNDRDGVLSFARAAEDYAFMHRRIERRLPVLEVNANPETIRRAIDAMAGAVRVARAEAEPGDLFNPRVEVAIRNRIARALRTHGMTAADVRAAELAEGIDPAGVPLKVNGTFPWAIGTAMVPCILEALPPLPPELQYRLVGRDLVLIDVHASLIVDILREALAADGTEDN
jgi:hypothetical protein